VQDFYGAQGYIDVNPVGGRLSLNRIPNTETGTMDLEFRIEEGQESYIEKIEIGAMCGPKTRSSGASWR